MFKVVILGIAGTCGFFAYVPQIVKTLKTKKSEDVSTAMMVILLLSSLCYGVYSFYVSDIMYRIVCWVDFSLALVSFIVTFMYRKKKEV